MINLLEKTREWIYQNKKRDCYQCEIIINNGRKNVGSMVRTFDVAKNLFPHRRTVAKAFENQIKELILENKLYNSRIVIKIICKIGTFKRKDIKWKSFS